MGTEVGNGLDRNHGLRASGDEFPRLKHTGCSAAWLARLLWEQEAAGSNPAIPTGIIRFPNLVSITKIHCGSIVARLNFA